MWRRHQTEKREFRLQGATNCGATGRKGTGAEGRLSEVCLGRLLPVLFSAFGGKVPSSHPCTGAASGHQWGFQKGLVSGFPGGPVLGSPHANAGDMGSIPGPGGFHMP